ncbi:MAG: Chitinase, family [Segetibacter sp.]|nr:Chitinase, family [Segetibacter sp.]
MKLSLILIPFILVVSSEGKSQAINKNNQKDFKVVGYYLLNSLLRDTIQNDSNYTFLDKVTHVNLAFINPDTSGNFMLDLPLDSFIKMAHNKNVKVLPSIAGGGPHTYYAALLRDDKRKMLVNNLVSLVVKYNMDGVDVDLEGNDIDTNYEAFVTDLATALKPLGKSMTAAIATAYKDKLTDKALQQFDFVNVMSYDRTGPWNPRKPGHHSPYDMAEEDLDYWSKTRLIPKEKLVLGVPFYGYGFGPVEGPVASMNYKQIVAAYPNSASVDTLLLADQKVMYYNGTSTIKKKAELAKQKASGIMIWQLSGDAPGENSLLKLINNILYKD